MSRLLVGSITYAPLEVGMFVCLDIGINWSYVVLAVPLHSQLWLRSGSYRCSLLALHRSSHSEHRWADLRGGGCGSVVALVIGIGVIATLRIVAGWVIVGSLRVYVLLIVWHVSAVSIVVVVAVAVVVVVALVITALAPVTIVVVILGRRIGHAAQDEYGRKQGKGAKLEGDKFR